MGRQGSGRLALSCRSFPRTRPASEHPPSNDATGGHAPGPNTPANPCDPSTGLPPGRRWDGQGDRHRGETPSVRHLPAVPFRVTQGGGVERREPYARRLPGRERTAHRALDSTVVLPARVPGGISGVRRPVALRGEVFGTHSAWSACTSLASSSPTEDPSSAAPSPAGSPAVAGDAESFPAREVRRVRGPGVSEHRPAWRPPEGPITHARPVRGWPRS